MRNTENVRHHNLFHVLFSETTMNNIEFVHIQQKDNVLKTSYPQN